MLHVNTILGYQYWASTRLRSQSFDICLDNKSWVGSLIRQNLKHTQNLNCTCDQEDINIILKPNTIVQYLDGIQILDHSSTRLGLEHLNTDMSRAQIPTVSEIHKHRRLNCTQASWYLGFKIDKCCANVFVHLLRKRDKSIQSIPFWDFFPFT